MSKKSDRGRGCDGFHQRGRTWYTKVKTDGKWHEISLGVERLQKAKQVRASKVEEFLKRFEPPQEKVIPPEQQSLTDYFEQTLKPTWKGTLSPATWLSYEGSFRVHILPNLGHLPLAEISRDKIKSFVAVLRRKPRAARKKKDNEVSSSSDSSASSPRLLSKETIRNILAALRAGLNEAWENTLIEANPAVRLGKLYKETPNFHEEIDPFSKDEVSRLLELTRQHFGYENYVLLLTLFHCGLRAGEAAGLHWPDLDVAKENPTLIVRRQFTRGTYAKTCR